MSTEMLERAFASTRSVLADVKPDQLPASVFINIAATDAFSHGWDLARATRQSCDLDAELAAQLLENARALLPETFRAPDGQAPFGPIAPALATASPADALTAFLGRTV